MLDATSGDKLMQDMGYQNCSKNTQKHNSSHYFHGNAAKCSNFKQSNVVKFVKTWESSLAIATIIEAKSKTNAGIGITADIFGSPF